MQAERNVAILARYLQIALRKPADPASAAALLRTAEERGGVEALLTQLRERAKADGPEAADAACLLISVTRQRGDAKGALDLAKSCIVHFPAHLGLLQLAGELQIESGAVNDGLANLNKALEILGNQENPDAEQARIRRQTLERLARAYYDLNQPEPGKKALDALLEAAPGEAGLRTTWAEYLERKGWPEESVALYRWLAENAPAYQRATAWREIARLEITRGKLEEAEQALRRGLELAAPGHWLREDLQASLAKLLLRREGIEAFQAELEARQAKAPRDLRALLDLRQLAENLADLPGQLKWQRLIVGVNKGNFTEQARLVELEIANGNLEEARALVGELRKRQPENTGLVLREAEIMLRLHREAEAGQMLQALWEAHPENAELQTAVEAFLQAQHLSALLVQMLEWRLARDPGSAELRVRLAEAEIQRRDFGAARAALSALIREGDPPARRAAASFQAYGVLQAGGDADGALTQLQQAVDLDPLHAPYVLELARLLAEAGRAPEAQALLERILERMPDQAAPAFAQVDQRLFELLRTASRGDSPTVESTFAERQRRERLRMRSQADALDKQTWTMPESTPPSTGPGLSPGDPGSGSGSDVAPDKPLLPDSPLNRYITGLQAAMEAEPTPGRSLRLARWLAWSRRFDEAREAARRTWELQPGLAPAAQLLFSLIGQEQEPTAALEMLSQLESAAADLAATRTDFLKKRAELLAREGLVPDSLETLREITRQQPREPSAWQELAVALQRAGLWFDALEAWDHALNLSHAEARLAVMRPYLGALQRLQLHARAWKLLNDAMEHAASDEERLKIFDELLTYARSEGDLDELAREYRQRLERQPNQPFLRQALARIQEALGEGREAAESLAQVAWLTPNSLKLLQTLAERAETAQEYGSAVRYLLEAARDPNVPAPILQKLAELQEKTFDYEGAEKSWNSALEKDSANVHLMRPVAEFLLRRNQFAKARALLDRAVAADPYEQDLRFLLAQVLLELGEAGESRKQLETLLEQLPSLPEDPGGLLAELPPFEIPDWVDLNVPVATAFDQVIQQDDLLVRDAAREFWRNERLRRRGLMLAVPRSRLRLESLALLGRLIDEGARDGKDPSAREKWMYRWRGAPATERLWAAYYSRSAYDLWFITQPLAANATEQRDSALQAFIWLNLDAGGYEYLAPWLQQADPHRELRRQFFAVSLSQLLSARQAQGATVDDVPRLFAGEQVPEDLMWPTAALMAATDYLPQAVDLGARALEMRKHLAASHGLTLASWRLRLGQTREAIALLRQQIASGESHSYSVQALSTRWAMLLLPPGERAPFIEWLERLGETPGKVPPAHAQLSLVIAHSMQGESAKAEAAIDALLKLRPVSYDDIRTTGEMPTQTHAYWNFVYLTGFQLMDWHLEVPAAQLWEKALSDPALIALQDDSSRELARTVRKQLFTERIIASRELPAVNLIRTYLRGTEDIMELRSMSAQLEEQQLYPELTILTEEMARREQDVEQSPDRLLRIYLQAGDLMAARRRLSDLRLASTEEGEAPQRAHQAALLFAQTLQESGQLKDAQTLLEDQLKDFPGDTECLQRLVAIYEARGLQEKVAPLCQTFLQLFPDSVELYSQWANSLRLTGRAQEALDTLNERFLPGRPMRALLLPVFFNLYMELNRPAEAENVLRQMLDSEQPASILGEGAKVLARNQRAGAAREILREALRRNRSPGYLYEVLNTLVLELPEDQPDLAQVRRDLRQMAQLSTVLEGSRSGLYERRVQAARLYKIVPELRAELQSEWRDGRGLKEAGVALLRLELGEDKKAAVAADLVARLVAHGDVTDDLPDRVLLTVKEAERWDLALLAARLLRARAPGSYEIALHEVEALYYLGKKAEAEALLTSLETHTLLNAQDALPFARVWQRWQDRARAVGLYAIALPRNQMFFPDDQAEFTKQQIAGGDLALARERLRGYYRYGTPVSFEPLREYFIANGRLGPQARIEPDSSFLVMSERTRIAWRVDLLEYALQTRNADLARHLASSYGEQILQKQGVVEKLLELVPDSIPALRYLAGYQVERGDFAQARAMLERALSAAQAAALTEDARQVQSALEALPIEGPK